MYELPIKIIMSEMETKIEGDIYKAIQYYDIDVDKEELLKALQYDRNQYKKGYEDALKEVRQLYDDSKYPEYLECDLDAYLRARGA